MSTQSTESTSITLLPIDRIYPSSLNPRQDFDLKQLAELAASMEAKGLQIPIRVRVQDPAAADPTYEIVAGERRWRAALSIRWAFIQSIVMMGLTDDEAVEIQMIDNMHRADLHPVEEAEGYRAIIAQHENAELLHERWSIEDVAAAVGKPIAYVAQRMRLLSLEIIPKQLLLENHIALGHALLLARLTPADQDRAVRHLLGMRSDQKKTSTEDYLSQQLKWRAEHSFYANKRFIAATEGELKDWITNNVLLQLKDVPWALTDPDLLPIAGACSNCPKRSGANTALFSDLTTEEDVCLDAACFGAKTKAVIAKIRDILDATTGNPIQKLSSKTSHAKLPEKTPSVIKEGQWVQVAKAEECKHTRLAVIIDGEKAGHTTYACWNQNCRTHKHSVDRPGGSGGGYDHAAESRRREEKQKAFLVTETPARLAIWKAIPAAFDASPTDLWVRELIAQRVLQASEATFCKMLGIKYKEPESDNQHSHDKAAKVNAMEHISKAPKTQLPYLAMAATACEHVSVRYWDHEAKDKGRGELLKLAKQFRVDGTDAAKKAEAAAVRSAGVAEHADIAPEKKATTKRKAPAGRATKKAAAGRGSAKR